MPLSGSLISLKDSTPQGYCPLLLCEFTFPDGTKLYASTHNLNSAEGGTAYGGNSYLARIDKQDIAQIQSRSEQGIDRISDVTLHLFNADQFLWTNYETASGKGFKGAFVKMSLVLMDIDPGTGNYLFTNDSPAPVKFSGICDAPNLEAGASIMAIRATTSHSLARVDFPILHVQQRCINMFPGTVAQQSEADNPWSWFFDCGYGPNAGNPGFTSCNCTKTDCIARGMYERDSAGRRTARFKAIQWAPAEVLGSGRKSGDKKEVATFSNRNDSIYNRSYPMLYGTQWVKPPIIANVIGDPNSTRMEVVICVGDIASMENIQLVLVNGVVVPPLGFVGAQALFRWNFLDQKTYGSVATGGRSGYRNTDFGYVNSGLLPQSDPYGGLATIEVVVFSDVAASNSIPEVRILCRGPKIPAPNTTNPADATSWPLGNTTNPAWVLLDLLIWGNYAYSEIDLQSFMDAAAVCSQMVSYVDLNGETVQHERFICEAALVERRGGNEVVQALLRSFRAQLVPNSSTGLLTLRIRQTLADQQPSVVSGSNFNTPVQSLRADGSAASGYVAYRIDEEIIQVERRNDQDVPKFRGPYCLPSAQVPNRITFQFQDRDNRYVDDSISIVDTEDVSRAGGYQAGGQQIQQQLPVIGISSFDQATRVGNCLLAESLRGNEMRDTRGTRFFEFESTCRLEHLHVGDIVLLQYQALVNSGALLAGGIQPLVPLSAGGSIPGILARVESLKPTTDFERVSVTVRWHEDYWHTDAYGQTAAPPFSGTPLLPVRLPFPWDPYAERPIVGDAVYSRTDFSFGIAQSYLQGAEGVLASLTIRGNPVVNRFTGSATPPFMDLQGSASPTGGHIAGGQRIHFAISSQGSDGLWTQLSQVGHAELEPGSDFYSIRTPDLFWQDGTAAWALFAGASEQDWSGQATGSGTPAYIELTELSESTFGAPDVLADSLVFEFKRIVHAGNWEDTCSAVGVDTLTFPGVTATDGQFVGHILSLQANLPGSESDVPIANFRVTSHTATVFTVSPNPIEAGIVAGMPFAMRAKFSMAADGTITDPALANSFAPAGLVVNGESAQGNALRVVGGTGRRQWRKIKSNTATSLTPDHAWDTALDSTSIVIVEEGTWTTALKAQLSASELIPATVPVVAEIDVTNWSEQSVLVQVRVADVDGNLSVEAFSPIREIFLWGSGTLEPPPDGLTYTPALYQYGSFTVENVAVATSAGLAGIDWFLVFVDELKADVFVTMNGSADAVSDPIVVGVTPNPLQVTTGFAFEVGDYILFNDAGKYEIGLLTAISTSGGFAQWTIQRHYPGAAAGTSTFEAPMAAHDTGTQLHKVQIRRFLLNSQTGAFADTDPPDRFDMPLPSSCVLAVVAAPYGTGGYGSWVNYNVASATVPGMRTCIGGEFSYQLTGALTAAVGSNAAVSFQVPFDQPYRVGAAYVGTAPTGASVKINSRYSSDGGGTWSTIEQYVIAIAAKNSWDASDPPEGRRSPYSGSWPFQVFRGGALLNFTIEQVGSTVAGSNLTLKLES